MIITDILGNKLFISYQLFHENEIASREPILFHIFIILDILEVLSIDSCFL